MTRSELLALVATELPTNGNNEISAADARGVFNNVINSMLVDGEEDPAETPSLSEVLNAGSITGAHDITMSATRALRWLNGDVTPKVAAFILGTITANRTIEIPDKSGTLAMLSDLPDDGARPNVLRAVIGLVAAPTGSESDGARYIVQSGTGAFAGHDNTEAEKVSGTWEFTATEDGDRAPILGTPGAWAARASGAWGVYSSGTSTLQAVLAAGNVTGGSILEVGDGDRINFRKDANALSLRLNSSLSTSRTLLLQPKNGTVALVSQIRRYTIDAFMDEPIGSEPNGTIYIVMGGTGAFTGYNGHLVEKVDGTWVVTITDDGDEARVKNAGFWVKESTEWVEKPDVTPLDTAVEAGFGIISSYPLNLRVPVSFNTRNYLGVEGALTLELNDSSMFKIEAISNLVLDFDDSNNCFWWVLVKNTAALTIEVAWAEDRILNDAPIQVAPGDTAKILIGGYPGGSIPMSVISVNGAIDIPREHLVYNIDGAWDLPPDARVIFSSSPLTLNANDTAYDRKDGRIIELCALGGDITFNGLGPQPYVVRAGASLRLVYSAGYGFYIPL